VVVTRRGLLEWIHLDANLRKSVLICCHQNEFIKTGLLLPSY